MDAFEWKYGLQDEIVEQIACGTEFSVVLTRSKRIYRIGNANLYAVYGTKTKPFEWADITAHVETNKLMTIMASSEKTILVYGHSMQFFCGKIGLDAKNHFTDVQFVK